MFFLFKLKALFSSFYFVLLFYICTLLAFIMFYLQYKLIGIYLPYLSIKEQVYERILTDKHNSYCGFLAPNEEKFHILSNITDDSTAEQYFLDQLDVQINQGGHYKPNRLHCVNPKKIAVIGIIKDREIQKTLFLVNIHRFLMNQQVEYKIFIVEQGPNYLFNRGKLANVGFKEALKDPIQFDCYYFHDIDTLPTNNMNLYNCQLSPQHLPLSIDAYNKIIYRTSSGAIVSFSREHYEQINGYSNMYWGWGSEDDDLYKRIISVGLTIHRIPAKYATYTAIQVNHNRVNIRRLSQFFYKMISGFMYKRDGLSSLNYTLLERNQYLLYSYILVDL